LSGHEANEARIVKKDSKDKQEIGTERNPSKLICLFALIFLIFSGPAILGIGFEVYSQSFVIQAVFDLAILVLLTAPAILLYSLLGKPAVILLTLLLTLLVLSRAIELFLLYEFNTGFHDAFFVHLDPVALKIAVQDYPVLVMAAVLMITLLPVLLYQLYQAILTVLTRRYSLITLVVFAPVILLFIYPTNHILEYSATARLIKEGKGFFASTPIQVNVDPRMVKQLDIDASYSNRFRANRNEGSKNLILVYLESFDLSFTDFGHSQYKGLTPNIDKFLAENTILAEHHSSETFTLAGIISSLCGFTPAMKKGNDSLFGTNHFQNVTCLSDILNTLDYEQVYFGGADKNFAGKATFLYTHRYDEVYGIQDLKDKYEKQASWGLYDTNLFNEAYKRIKKLSAGEDPFNVTLLTLNTHIPGVRSENCPKYSSRASRFLDAIHCTDHDFGVFIQKLEKDGLLVNTVLVITADHHVFRTRQIKDLFGQQLRDKRIVAAIYSPDTSLPRSIENTATYDMAPTILDLMGIDHNASFLLGESAVNRQANRSGTRAIIDRHDRRLAKINCDSIQKLDELCKVKLTLAIQDGIVEKTDNTHTDEDLAACENWSGIKVRASNDGEQPSEVRLRGRDILNHVSEKGWPINKRTRDGVFFVSVRRDGSEDDLRFFDARKPGSAQKMRQQLMRSSGGQLGVLLANGDASSIMDRESVKFFQKAGIKQLDKLRSGDPFVILFTKQNGVKYLDFYAVNNRPVETEFSMEKCGILTNQIMGM